MDLSGFLNSGVVSNDEKIILNISNDEIIMYENAHNEFTLSEPVAFDKDDAVKIALQLLDSASLMPDDDFIISVSEVIRQVIDTDTDLEIGVEEVMAYDIRILHTFNGKPVFSKDKEGISLTITSSGLSELTYKWTDLNSASSLAMNNLQSKVDYSNLFSRYSNDFTSLWDSCDLHHDIFVSDAFYLQNGKLIDIVLFDIDSFGHNRVGLLVESQEWIQ